MMYKWVGDETLPSFPPLHPHGQAPLLRSYAGGLSVVASADCMLYAASEVSAFPRQTVFPWPHPPHTPGHHSPDFPVTFPVFFLLRPRVPLIYHAGTLSGVLARHTFTCSLRSWLHDMQISHDFHSAAPCCLVCTHTLTNTSWQKESHNRGNLKSKLHRSTRFICKNRWRKKKIKHSLTVSSFKNDWFNIF